MKKKAIWYVILRAIREKARPMLSGWEKKHQMDLSDTLQRTSRRLNAIQKWMGFSDVILDRWKSVAGEYLSWLADGAKKKSITRDDISDNYPILWRRFVREKDFDDDFMSKIIPSQSEEEDVWKRLNNLKIDEGKKPQRELNQRRKTKQPSDVQVDDEIDIEEPLSEEEET